MLASQFDKGIDQFDALRTQYKVEPWYKDLEGNLHASAVAAEQDDLSSVGKTLSGGLAWNYDGMEVAKRLDTPQLWQLATDDLGHARSGDVTPSGRD